MSLLCKIGLHSSPRSQGLVGYCLRGCGDLKRTHRSANGWQRYVEPPKPGTRPR